MDSVIIRPEIPYYNAVPLNFSAGNEIIIDGIIPFNGTRFSVELQCNFENIALATLVDLSTKTILINSKDNNIWGEMKTISISQDIDMQCNHKFKLAIRYDSEFYTVSINNQKVVEYPQKISVQRVADLVICGEIQVFQITYSLSDVLPSAPPPSYDECTNFVYSSLSTNNYQAVNLSATATDSSAPNHQQITVLAPASSNLQPDPSSNQTGAKKCFIAGLVIFIFLLFVIRKK